MRPRGFALVAVMAVLALVLVVLALLAKILMDDLAETRRRGNAAYARELARSGLAYARASIARGGGLAPETFDVEGGRIEVRPDMTGSGLSVVAVGTVLGGEAVLARHAAAFDAGTPTRRLHEPPAVPVEEPMEPPVVEEAPFPEAATPVPVPER